MNIFYHISPYPSLSEDMVAKIYEAASSDAPVDSVTIAAPHTSPVSVSFMGRDNVTHVVRLFTADTGTLLHEYDVQPTEDVVTIFDDIRFKVGDGDIDTPMVNDTAIVRPELANMTIDDFRIYRNGYGFLYPNYHFTFSSDDTAGTITLLVPPTDAFADGEEILITRKPKVVTNPVNDSVVGKQFGGNDTIPDMFIDVNTTVNYAPEHLRHLIRLAGANANYVFPEDAAIPVGYIFRVTNFGTYASITDKGKVTFNNAPLIWASSPKTELDIQFTGTYEFEFDGTNWNCTMYNVGATVPTTPQIVYAASVDIGTMISTDQQFVVSGFPEIVGYPLLKNYMVSGNLVSNSGDWNNDNDVMFVISEKTATSFKLSVRRIGNGPQKLKFDFILVT